MDRDGLEPGYALLDGLPGVLQELYRMYRPAPEGICAILPEARISMPIPAWAEYCISATYSASYTATQNAALTVTTVPPDERWWLEAVRSSIATGDNEVQFLDIRPADGYVEVSGNATILLGLTSTAPTLYWPDIAGRQTVTHVVDRTDIMLEPGTVITQSVNGVGVGAGTISVEIRSRRCKINHARAPIPL